MGGTKSRREGRECRAMTRWVARVRGEGPRQRAVVQPCQCEGAWHMASRDKVVESCHIERMWPCRPALR